MRAGTGGDGRIRTGDKGFADPPLRPLGYVAWPIYHDDAGEASSGGSYGAEDGIRTRDPHLGKVMLYQLSYFRILFKNFWDCKDRAVS